MRKRIAVGAALALVTALLLTATASASEPLADGVYTIALPDSTTVEFTVSNGGTIVEVADLTADFTVTEDDSSDGSTTRIVKGDVTVEIKTGDEGGIEIDGVSFADFVEFSTTLPDRTVVTITVDGDKVDVVADGFRIVDVDSDDDEVEVTITDDDRTFEIEVNLERGSVEINVKDDDSSSEDDSVSDDDDSDDEIAEVATTVADDSSSDDDDSDDDDSDDTTTESTVEQTTDVTPTTASSIDDDSDDDDSDDESGDKTTDRSKDDRRSEDDRSDD